MRTVIAELKRTFCYITMLFFILLGSCQKDKLKDEKAILTGNWEWSYTQHTYGWCGGLAFYETIAPEQDGNNYAVSFMERGKLNFYKNEKRQGSFRIVFQEFVKVDESRYAFQLKLNNDTLKTIEGMVSEDTLNIKYPYVESDPNCENYLNFFVRE